MDRMRLLALWVGVIVHLGVSTGVANARGMTLIRDAEIENTIGALTAPLLQAAGIGEDAVTIRILGDNSLNAFATTEMRIFIHSGLIMRTEDAGALVGVLAHETGHLAGGHLLRLRDQIMQATVTSLLTALAGAAAGVASGRGDVAGAVALGGQEIAKRNFLSFSRAQENAADAFAMRILDATHQSAKGLLAFMRTLEDQELLYSDSQDPYVRTHPLTRDRINALANHVAQSPYSDSPLPTAEQAAWQRSRAKLLAFLQPPMVTLRAFAPTDDSVAARYARSIAYYRGNDVDKALPLLDSLIAEYPNDPYFHELKGQILFEFQRLDEAVGAYRKAVALAPTEPLILTALGHAEVEAGRPDLLEAAKTTLTAAVRLEPENHFAWRYLATAYGRTGEEGMAAYALAEMALLEGKPGEALAFAKRAEGQITKSQPAWLRVQDLVAEAQRQKDRKDKE